MGCPKVLCPKAGVDTPPKPPEAAGCDWPKLPNENAPCVWAGFDVWKPLNREGVDCTRPAGLLCDNIDDVLLENRLLPKAGVLWPKAVVDCPKAGVDWPKVGVDCPNAGVDWPKAGVDCPNAGVDCPNAGVED